MAGHSHHSGGCCSSPHTRRCCISTAAIGLVMAVLGVLLLVGGHGFMERKILDSMALSPGSSRLASWLVPPVQAHLSGYGFHVTNPEEVMRGEKPILKEVGPFVYKAVTVKDSVNSDGSENLVYGEDGRTLTYRPRKFYYLDRSQSVGDPDTTYLTVPNIPILTAFSKIRDYGWKKFIGKTMILNKGAGTPFINITFSGLLWGYEDEMPCMTMETPDACYNLADPVYPDIAIKPAAEVEVEAVEEEEEDEDGFGDWGDGDDDWKRKKREVGRVKREGEQEVPELNLPNVDLRTLDFRGLDKPKGEVVVGEVDCKCTWGLFRDRNVTLRKPLKIHHGMADLSKKGWVEEFDGKKTLDWWVPGTQCDAVGGQDTSTLPPLWTTNSTLDFYTPLMCRRIQLDFEKETSHLGLDSLRFIPSIKQLASPHDEDPDIRNEANSCYCVEGFSCLKSGVFNMEPCKRKDDLPRGAPIALSYPHFYQADQSYHDAVVGLKPDKEKHQFYIDIAPKFGFPLAIRPRFQLNAIIRRDPDITVMAGFQEELVLPFLWAQDGFSEPSHEMAHKIGVGLAVPGLAPVAGGGLLGLGLLLLLIPLLWSAWARKVSSEQAAETFPLS